MPATRFTVIIEGKPHLSENIVGLGEILWDILPSGKQLGGAPANFAYYTQELSGVASSVVSCVGADASGQELLSYLERFSLNTKYVGVDNQHPTGSVLVEIDAKQNHSFNIEENVAWDFIRETPSLKKLAENTSAVCFGSLAQRSQVSRNTIRTFVENTPSSSMRIFDINLRQSFYPIEIIETSLNLSNMFKVNEYELSIIANLLSINGSEKSIIVKLANRFNLRVIIFTKGEKGSIIYSKEQERAFNHNGFLVNVMDSVGAGDAFTASVVVGMLKGYDYDYINDCANRVASFVCSQSGATPQLSDEIKNLFKT